MSARHYLAQLQALLPRGAAWLREQTATLTMLLYALADEFARVDGRSFDLLEEADPRTTYELLPEWEFDYGLPDPCTGQLETIQQRREALVTKVTMIGGQSRQYFIDLAARLGFEITITEFEPFTVGSTVDEPICDEAWRWTWMVNAPEVRVIEFTAESGVNEALQTWGNELLECAITRLKPAHTNVLFAYGE